VSLLAVVGWDPTLTGYLAVLVSILVLCGSVYMLLATNLGLRLGFLVAWTGLWSWNFLMGVIWWVFGIGWSGQIPTWQVSHVATDPAAVPIEEVLQLSNDLTAVPEDWEVVVEPDALSAADSHIVCADDDVRRLEPVNSCRFQRTTQYTVHRVLETGGERYRPLGIPDNAFTQYFIPSRGRPHYAVVQLQANVPAVEVNPNLLDDDGQVILPQTAVDPASATLSVVLYRDQGTLRLRPALVTIFSGLLFALGCYHLHRRDQAVWAVREAAGA